MRGTGTYMAPEVRNGLAYDGRKSDIFSIGVILFMIVKGYWPFNYADKKDIFYNCIINQ